MEENKKVGLTSLNWILCIFGILLFTSFAVLPPMLRLYLPREDEVITPTPTPSSNTANNQQNTTQNICEKVVDGKTSVYNIFANGESVEMLAETITNSYLDNQIPDEERIACDNNNLNYANILGLYYNCSIDDNNLVISSRVYFNEYDKSKTLPFTINYTANKSQIVNELTSNGFSCQETSN